jgi:hypothetical protein
MARRKALTWIFRLASSTDVSGHARAISSSLLITCPARSVRAVRMSNARLPSRTGLSPSSNKRRVANSRYGPNEMAGSPMGPRDALPFLPNPPDEARGRTHQWAEARVGESAGRRMHRWAEARVGESAGRRMHRWAEARVGGSTGGQKHRRAEARDVGGAKAWRCETAATHTPGKKSQRYPAAPRSSNSCFAAMRSRVAKPSVKRS